MGIDKGKLMKRVFRSNKDKDERREVGVRAEGFCEEYLRWCDYRIFHRNWKCRQGEIDLVAGENEQLVFVEVKARVRGGLADSLVYQSIDRKKQRRLRLLAEIYARRFYAKRPIPPMRIDAFAVILTSDFRVVCFQQLRAAM